MSYIDFAALKQRLCIEESIPLLGLSLKQRNGQWRGPCPACKSGGERALVVTPAKDAFYCFGERTGGDVIAFAAHILGCNVKQAAAFLFDKTGEGKCANEAEAGSGNGIDTVPEERNKEAARSLQPLSYLQPGHDSLARLGLEEETCNLFSAGFAPKGIMRGRLAIPIHDESGTLIAYCGRTLKDEAAVWVFPKGFNPSGFVFNAHMADGGELVLLRDPIEVMQAAQNGIENAVSFLTDTITASQLRLLADLMDKLPCDHVHMA